MNKIINVIIIISILFLNGIEISAQNIEPPSLTFNYVYDSQTFTNAPFSLDRVKQTHFALGWQWGGHNRMTEALKMNMDHDKPAIYNITQPTNPNDTLYYIWQPLVGGWYVMPYMLISSFQYEPTLKIANPNGLNIKPNDTSNAIWGFKYIRGYISNNPADENFDRLILYNEDSLRNQIVLAEPSLSGNLYKKDGIDFTINNEQIFISINLRRINDNSDGDEPVLEISIPAIKAILDKDRKIVGYDSTTIKFDSIPDKIKERIHLNDYNDRGYAMDIDVAPPSTTVITITKDMINKSSSTIGNDITISAKFFCDQYHNYYLKPGSGTLTYIDTLKINVKYLGNCPIGIDWIRIENPRAQRLFRGGYDDFKLTKPFFRFKNKLF
jgi:hypothetical protein